MDVNLFCTIPKQNLMRKIDKYSIVKREVFVQQNNNSEHKEGNETVLQKKGLEDYD